MEEGSLFGIIGPDGAGKTSLFHIMTTLIVPDSGSAQVCGYDTVKDMMEIRRLVGYMPGHFSLYQDLTVEGDRLHIVSPSLSLAELSERAASAGYDISTLAECTPTVEDCFMDFDTSDYE